MFPLNTGCEHHDRFITGNGCTTRRTYTLAPCTDDCLSLSYSFARQGRRIEVIKYPLNDDAILRLRRYSLCTLINHPRIGRRWSAKIKEFAPVISAMVERRRRNS